MNKNLNDDRYFYFSKIAYMTTREAALAMSGFDYNLEDKELTREQLEAVDRLKKAITRNLQTVMDKDGGRAASNVNYPSHRVLSAAYTFQRADVTPVEVVNIINNAVMKLALEKNGVEELKLMGGDELHALGKKFRHQKRGVHKREDEERGNYKLIAFLIELLQRHGKANYTDLSSIYRDIINLCEEKGVPSDGIKKSTFYKKVDEAKSLIKLDVSF